MRSLPALLVAVLAGGLLAGLACGGGGSNGETAALIHRLLLAAGTDQAGSLESFPGQLPPGLPVEPPQYPGAKLIVSSRQPAPVSSPADGATGGDVAQPLLYFIVLDTPDSRQDVYTFYEQTLDQDPWQLESSFSTPQLDTFQFFDVQDADIAGAVSIAQGGDDGRTSILISLQDAGAFLDELPPFDLGESLAVPQDFPAEIPRYPEATVTGSAFFREPASQSFLLIFITLDTGSDVLDFYKQAFQAKGWTVQENEPSSLEERIEYRDADRTVTGEVFTNPFAPSRRYTEVHLRVLLKPSGGQPTPGETATPIETGAATETPAP
jgi:hypothetical protein